MTVAKRYRIQAARQRKIAIAIPLSSVRQHFLASAERLEVLAQAEEDLTGQGLDDVG